MPTILTHPAVPLALGGGLGNTTISRRLLIAGIAASIVPDLDVIGFAYGIPYGSPFGHRGFTHSLSFAIALALTGAIFCRRLQVRFATAFLFLFAAAASHGILDAFTNGGLGVAFLWPWSAERFFAPFQVIAVSPIGISRFLSPRGIAVILSEVLWIWLPASLIAATLAGIRNRLSHADHVHKFR